ncbi:hypothetical protein [Thalassobacillus sp. B23F22_16]|uniref:hypothetical protein n=1 Tax=Thalassobacillus sp. B23F22_16 TaxID=3459513 RepID=UPI00373E7F69
MSKKLIEWFLILSVFGLSAIIGNWVGYDVMPLAAVPGMIVLILISVLGLLLEKVVPWNIPAVGYIGLIGILISIPWFPGSEYVVQWTTEINILALATPILAYAGLSIGKNWADFTKLGWRSVVVAVFVFVGTFVGSAIIAEIILRVQGII